MSGERDCRGVVEKETNEVGCFEKDTDFKGHGLPDNKVRIKTPQIRAIRKHVSGGRVGEGHGVPRCLSDKAQLLPLDLEQCHKHLLAEVK